LSLNQRVEASFEQLQPHPGAAKAIVNRDRNRTTAAREDAHRPPHRRDANSSAALPFAPEPVNQRTVPGISNEIGDFPRADRSRAIDFRRVAYVAWFDQSATRAVSGHSRASICARISALTICTHTPPAPMNRSIRSLMQAQAL
jgi:hypothetical protein